MFIWVLGEVVFDFFGFSVSYSTAIDWKNSSKTKVEKMFFFIFMSSFAEMSFLRGKITKYGPTIFFLNRSIWG
jgi:hypothetical protein